MLPRQVERDGSTRKRAATTARAGQTNAIKQGFPIPTLLGGIIANLDEPLTWVYSDTIISVI
jgi:hypothetical protein